MASIGMAAIALAGTLCLSGCANLGYYWQSASGHLKMLSAARPVDDWLADTQAPERLKSRLALSQRIRSYAVSELKLPDNPSYRRYADLQRTAVVWNVVAAPKYSVKLKTWCFPVTGCVSYRGYFDEAQARAESARLAAEGFDSNVYPVPAYSTLGWMNWAGGDPLLNTFIYYPEGELARLIFHELAHQVVYAKDDTMFNESFATSVERLGGARWLETQAGEDARKDYAEFNGRRTQFRAMALATRKRLEKIYSEMEGDARESAKQEALRDFRASYVKLRDSWGGDSARFRGFDQYVERANNASFGAQAAYDELVPGFEALYAREGRDWRRFYDAAKRLAELPKDERHKLLKETS
ncbi:aminopeptidase [Caenimonas aquaedulcis]|uniref:Aminopeptidase n=1 Tax=Caenimonas aquaedulcis TaxID=2793270 RepID=A0A931H746_9BURK|nr:aminopeptidase [Caenimonas aquaedulcis]MBG9389758.1 aminopeptidase [Caenimonas aquaedulcis]